MTGNWWLRLSDSAGDTAFTGTQAIIKQVDASIPHSSTRKLMMWQQ
jgi:hypothetical protein